MHYLVDINLDLIRANALKLSNVQIWSISNAVIGINLLVYLNVDIGPPRANKVGLFLNFEFFAVNVVIRWCCGQHFLFQPKDLLRSDQVVTPCLVVVTAVGGFVALCHPDYWLPKAAAWSIRCLDGSKVHLGEQTRHTLALHCRI